MLWGGIGRDDKEAMITTSRVYLNLNDFFHLSVIQYMLVLRTGVSLG